MIGSFFALLAAASFALNGIFLRRAVLKISDASLGTLITIPMGVPFFFVILAFSNQLQSVLSFAWQEYVWLSLAGIIQFVVGRSLSYNSVQLVGANVTSILRRIDIFLTVIIGVLWLQEPFSWQLAIGVLLIVAGITLPGLSFQMSGNPGARFSKIPLKALLFGFGNGIAWGIGPVCMKLGLKGSGSPIAGAFIAFLAATIFLSISMVSPKRRNAVTHISGRVAGLFLISGLMGWIANFFRFTAISMAPASVVSPLVAISPVFLLVFSFLFNRKLEIFNKPLIIGTVTVVIGTILLV